MHHGTHDHDPHAADHGHADPGPADHDHADELTFGGHGMLVIGEGTVYLSHLPMFMFSQKGHPHNFQVILEVTLSNGGGSPQAVYVQDRKETGTNVYTLNPEEFSLADLDPHDLRLQSFRGTIFRGHFERRGKPILEDILVNVTNVVHFREFDPGARDISQLEYFLFGKGEELFLGHLITKPPDFDQLVSVRVVGHEFANEELNHGVPVTFPGRANSRETWARSASGSRIAGRLMEGELVKGEFRAGGATSPLTVEALRELYMEKDELAAPM